MTPTLFGRWQSRLFIISTLGALITYLFALFNGNDFATFFAVLVYALVIGILLDIVYQYAIQIFRWDSDWPPVYVFLTGLLECFILWLILNYLPPGISAVPPFSLFLAHYSSVWLAVFIMLFGGMRILFPRWRFNGGQIGLGILSFILLGAWAMLTIGLPIIYANANQPF